MWALIAAVVAFLALEEISWGQRMLGLSTPEALSRVNIQGELNLHNIESLNYPVWQRGLGWALLTWTLISAAALLVRQWLKVDPMVSGLPILPLRLLAGCLVVVFLFLTSPVVKSDEFGELALALLGLIWAADLYPHFSTRPERASERLLRNRFTPFVAAVALMSAITLMFPENSSFGFWLNYAAAHKFPEAGLMEQSHEIFDYILAHPVHITDETLANYYWRFPDQMDQ